MSATQNALEVVQAPREETVSRHIKQESNAIIVEDEKTSIETKDVGNASSRATSTPPTSDAPAICYKCKKKNNIPLLTCPRCSRTLHEACGARVKSGSRSGMLSPPSLGVFVIKTYCVSFSIGDFHCVRCTAIIERQEEKRLERAQKAAERRTKSRTTESSPVTKESSHVLTVSQGKLSLSVKPAIETSSKPKAVTSATSSVRPAVSGFSTFSTGSLVLKDPVRLPLGLLFWCIVSASLGGPSQGQNPMSPAGSVSQRLHPFEWYRRFQISLRQTLNYYQHNKTGSAIHPPTQWGIPAFYTSFLPQLVEIPAGTAQQTMQKAFALVQMGLKSVPPSQLAFMRDLPQQVQAMLNLGPYPQRYISRSIHQEDEIRALSLPVPDAKAPVPIACFQPLRVLDAAVHDSEATAPVSKEVSLSNEETFLLLYLSDFLATWSRPVSSRNEPFRIKTDVLHTRLTLVADPALSISPFDADLRGETGALTADSSLNTYRLNMDLSENLALVPAEKEGVVGAGEAPTDISMESAVPEHPVPVHSALSQLSPPGLLKLLLLQDFGGWLGLTRIHVALLSMLERELRNVMPPSTGNGSTPEAQDDRLLEPWNGKPVIPPHIRDCLQADPVPDDPLHTATAASGTILHPELWVERVRYHLLYGPASAYFARVLPEASLLACVRLAVYDYVDLTIQEKLALLYGLVRATTLVCDIGQALSVRMEGEAARQAALQSELADLTRELENSMREEHEETVRTIQDLQDRTFRAKTKSENASEDGAQKSAKEGETPSGAGGAATPVPPVASELEQYNTEYPTDEKGRTTRKEMIAEIDQFLMSRGLYTAGKVSVRLPLHPAPPVREEYLKELWEELVTMEEKAVEADLADTDENDELTRVFPALAFVLYLQRYVQEEVLEIGSRKEYREKRKKLLDQERDSLLSRKWYPIHLGTSGTGTEYWIFPSIPHTLFVRTPDLSSPPDLQQGNGLLTPVFGAPTPVPVHSGSWKTAGELQRVIQDLREAQKQVQMSERAANSGISMMQHLRNLDEQERAAAANPASSNDSNETEEGKQQSRPLQNYFPSNSPSTGTDGSPSASSSMATNSARIRDLACAIGAAHITARSVSAYTWGYYHTRGQVEQLIHSLVPKGANDGPLAKSLNTWLDVLFPPTSSNAASSSNTPSTPPPETVYPDSYHAQYTRYLEEPVPTRSAAHVFTPGTPLPARCPQGRLLAPPPRKHGARTTRRGGSRGNQNRSAAQQADQEGLEDVETDAFFTAAPLLPFEATRTRCLLFLRFLLALETAFYKKLQGLGLHHVYAPSNSDSNDADKEANKTWDRVAWRAHLNPAPGTAIPTLQEVGNFVLEWETQLAAVQNYALKSNKDAKKPSDGEDTSAAMEVDDVTNSGTTSIRDTTSSDVAKAVQTPWYTRRDRRWFRFATAGSPPQLLTLRPSQITTSSTSDHQLVTPPFISDASSDPTAASAPMFYLWTDPEHRELWRHSIKLSANLLSKSVAAMASPSSGSLSGLYAAVLQLFYRVQQLPWYHASGHAAAKEIVTESESSDAESEVVEVSASAAATPLADKRSDDRPARSSRASRNDRSLSVRAPKRAASPSPSPTEEASSPSAASSDLEFDVENDSESETEETQRPTAAAAASRRRTATQKSPPRKAPAASSSSSRRSRRAAAADLSESDSGVVTDSGSDDASSVSSDGHDTECFECNKEGDVFPCSGCPKVFHRQCVRLRGALPEPWFCPYCKADPCPTCRLPVAMDEAVGCGPDDEEAAKAAFKKQGKTLHFCEKAFHLSCVGLSRLPRGDWYCKRCRAKNK